MSMSFTRTRRAACMLLLLFAGPGIYSAWSADAWHVAEAPVRFRLSLGQGPSHSSAGYYLHLPDGGILPGPNPVTRVVDSSGKIDLAL